MAMKKRIGLVESARVGIVLGVFVLAGLGQQKAAPVIPGGSQQGITSMAQQQAQMLAQAASPLTPSRSGQGSMPASLSEADDPSLHLQDQARLKRNDERQRKLENDATRLLTLANLLKIEVAASGSESMTPEMLRQMDEIEKLARSVKDRMRS